MGASEGIKNKGLMGTSAKPIAPRGTKGRSSSIVVPGGASKRGAGLLEGGPSRQYKDKSIGTGAYKLTDRAVSQRSMGR